MSDVISAALPAPAHAPAHAARGRRAACHDAVVLGHRRAARPERGVGALAYRRRLAHRRRPGRLRRGRARLRGARTCRTCCRRDACSALSALAGALVNLLLAWWPQGIGGGARLALPHRALPRRRLPAGHEDRGGPRERPRPRPRHRRAGRLAHARQRHAASGGGPLDARGLSYPLVLTVSSVLAVAGRADGRDAGHRRAVRARARAVRSPSARPCAARSGRTPRQPGLLRPHVGALRGMGLAGRVPRGRAADRPTRARRGWPRSSSSASRGRPGPFSEAGSPIGSGVRPSPSAPWRSPAPAAC